MSAIVGRQAGVSWEHAYRGMPAKLAYAFEHEYWRDQGYSCTKAITGSLEDELADLLNL